MMRWPWTKQRISLGEARKRAIATLEAAEERRQHLNAESEAGSERCICGHLVVNHLKERAFRNGEWCLISGCFCSMVRPQQRSVDGNQNPTPDATERPGDVPEHQHEWHPPSSLYITEFCLGNCGALKHHEVVYVPEPLPISPPALQQTGVEGEGCLHGDDRVSVVADDLYWCRHCGSLRQWGGNWIAPLNGLLPQPEGGE